MSHASRNTGWLLVATVALLAACQSPTASSVTTPTLTVMGAASAPAVAAVGPARIAPSASDTGYMPGDPSSVSIRMYALWVSSNADCSAPQLVQNYGDGGQDKDFAQNPVLFSGAPADGAYPCMMFRMSDVIRVTTPTTFGGCVAGTEYPGDIHRDGDVAWVDQDLNVVAGHGTEDAPVDDHVTIFFARDTLAAQARGISGEQIVPLLSDLVVPGQSTFYMNARDRVYTDGVRCGLERPTASFQ